MDTFLDLISTQISNNFDCAYMIIINLITYFVIKLVDYFNGNKKVTTWQKRAILISVIVIITTIYTVIGYENKIVLFNSAIVAPVFWSWVLKPIVKKFGLDYKENNNENR